LLKSKVVFEKAFGNFWFVKCEFAKAIPIIKAKSNGINFKIVEISATHPDIFIDNWFRTKYKRINTEPIKKCA
ncbi:hypothetical protein JIY74_37770, partial [Vibrio harveyi]|nr:hypothetical protein [Vibrio harveyi]